MMFPEEVIIAQKEITEDSELSDVSISIIKALLYFDIFNHPLNLNEIIACGNIKAGADDYKQSLEKLIRDGTVSNHGGFYYVSDDPEIINRRVEGNRSAEKHFRIAKKISRLISSFPFVRCVSISGTLSKNYFDKNSDIDYFIITAPGRLWLCRTMLILFKKIILLNSKKYFCVNYFIDTDNLEIPDKNIFTATELVHIIPTYNAELYNDFISSNSWVRSFYPNKKMFEGRLPSGNNLIKRISEKMLSGRMGEKIDKWCFQRTIGHWKKKFPEFNEEEFDLNLRSKKNVSKHHPQGFQFKVTKAYEEKIKWFEKKLNIKLA